MKLASEYRRLTRYYGSLGLRGAAQWRMIMLRQHQGWEKRSVVEVCPKPLTHPISLRTGQSSDLDVFHQLVVEQEYNFLTKLVQPKRILDLGANIGLASASFLSAFPGVRLIAVEPDPANFEMCRRNLAPYGARATALQGAVWNSRTKLKTSRGTFGDGRDWAVEVVAAENGDGDVEGWDIPSLIEELGGGPVDLLKVDIEGSEVALFDETSKQWLDQVRNLCIELHGPECERVFTGSLAAYDYETIRSGELTVCLNIRRKAGSFSPMSRSTN